MKIAILGAGAIGTVIAGSLASIPNVELLLSSRGEQALALMTTGLKLTGVVEKEIPASEWLVHPEGAELPGNWLRQTDYCIVCGKSASTSDLAEIATQLLSQEGLVFSLQNGILAEKILSEKCGEHRVIGAITTHGAGRLSPGNTQWAGEGNIVLGSMNISAGEGAWAAEQSTPISHSIDGVGDLLDVLSEGGLSPQWTEDIHSMLWVKLLINCAINPIAAICGVENGALFEIAELREQSAAVMLEAANVGRLSRINLPPDEELINTLNDVLQSTANNSCSMLQDIRNGKLTEIDAITGEVVRIAEILGMPVPLNSQLLVLIHGIESGLKIN